MIQLADPQFDERELDAIRAVVESGQVTDGPVVREFETEFAGFCGAEYGVATTNGTTALQTALTALGIGEGDHVLTTPFSFVASANAIRFAGATPVFSDIDSSTFNLAPDAAEAVVRERAGGPKAIDAILPVHLFGLPAEMARFDELAEEYDLAVIEDAAQAHGAAIDGKRVGTFGDAACFSFYPSKNMTTGEGGMVLTDEEEVAERAASFTNHGRPGAHDSASGYEHVRMGGNFRMSSVLAAIGRVQLRERLREGNAARREHAAELTAGLSDVLETPSEPDGYRHVYHQYTVRSDDRDSLEERLAGKGIATKVYYPRPIHEQPIYEEHGSFPEAERAAREVLSVPVHPGLDGTDIERIVAAVEEIESTDCRELNQ